MKRVWMKTGIFVAAIAVLGMLAYSGAVMLLWNNILAATLHVGAISIWQAAGILLLAKLLCGGRRRRMHRMHGRCNDTHRHMKWERYRAAA